MQTGYLHSAGSIMTENKVEEKYLLYNIYATLKNDS